jgi:hypothetical protein
LDETPEWQKEEGRFVIDLPIKNDEGLELRYYAACSDSGIWLPRFSYLFNNERIRGLDFHYSYINFEKTKSSGWHEHKWLDRTQYAERYPNEDFVNIPRERQIDYILKKWNIDYKEQYRMEFKEE